MKSLFVFILIITSFSGLAAESSSAKMPKVPQQTIDIVTDTTLPKELKDEARVVKKVVLEWRTEESTIL